MVPEKYRLAAVGKFLLESFERRRPGLTAWTPEVERDLRAEGEAALVEMERQCKELGIDDPVYWRKVRGALDSVLLPRYAVLAQGEIALARAGYHLWRGGDLRARIAYAATGLVLGSLAVAIPWIPVTEKWVPWMLFILGPFLPDGQLWYYARRHQRRLQKLVDDLAEADKSLDTYRPLSELQQVLENETVRAPSLELVQPPMESAATGPASADPQAGSARPEASSLKTR